MKMPLIAKYAKKVREFILKVGAPKTSVAIVLYKEPVSLRDKLIRISEYYLIIKDKIF